MTKVRWWMLALLFFGTTLNYLDRIVFAFLARDIRAEIHFNDEVYGRITSAFSFAYMIGFLFAGKFIDRYGTRIGYAVAMAWWSLAAGLHAFSNSALSFGFWRAMLGFGESGNFPAAIKSVAEWFPKKERAFATGLFNAGSNFAAMFGPFLIAFLAVRYGWRACFIITASIGLLLLAAWLLTYRPPDAHPGVNQAELEHIHSDVEERESAPRIGWAAALTYKQTWAFAFAKFITDPVWWFYLWWLPLYLGDVHKLTTEQTRWPLLVVYAAADVGSIFFGWVSGALIRRGWASGRARKTAMLLCACAMPISLVLAFTPTVWVGVACIAVICAAHQGWSANLFTTTSDIFPKEAVASVTGVGGFAGGLGGALFAALIPGIVIQRFGYVPVFVVMGFFHLTALLVVHRVMGDVGKLTVPARRAPAAQY